MRVLVTGGTGFVGSHSVKAIVDAGHDVRLLVRSAERIAPALDPLGVAAPEHVVGDVTDEMSVQRALEGCDAVLNAAAVFSYDARDAARVQAVNGRAADVVLRAARDAGLDPIVHVSSYVALLPPSGTLDGDSPVGRPRGTYAETKAHTEQIARTLQDEGVPVVTTYPGMVWGPHDPYLGEIAAFTRSVLRRLVPMLPPGVLPIVDVREVAAAHAAALEPGRGPRRYLLGGESLSLLGIIRILRELTGRRLPAVEVPARPVLAMAAAADAAQRVSPVRLPVNFGAVWVVGNGAQVDGSAAERELGIRYRPPRQSIADMLRWLHAAGHVSDRQAGAIAAAAPEA